jgi:hypothetical protein
MAVEIRPRQLETNGVGEPSTSWRRVLTVGAAAVMASTMANVVVAQALAGLLQVPTVFAPLQAPSVASLTVVGVSAAILVFAALARLSANPIRVFTILAAVGLVITWLPDVLLYTSGTFPGTTAAGVLSLMSLHVVAATVVVLLVRRYGLSR